MSDISNEELGTPEVKKHPFKLTSFNEFVKQDYEPLQKLVGDFIYSEQLTLFYGLSGVGKSMFAVQMGLAISEGQDLDLGNGIVLENQCEPIKTLYIDLELSERQFHSRVKGLNGYSNFVYGNIDIGQALDSKNVIKVFQQIKAGAEDAGATCIIIDNISRVSGDIEKTEHAKDFMNACLALARDKNYSVIVVAHITKKEPFLPITKNDLRGSGVLYDLCDSALSIGKAKRVNPEKNMEVYLIQMKTRSDKYFYNDESVIHCVQNIENGFLKLDAIGLEKENDLLMENVLINTERARNRIFYTLCYLYYGSSRKAESKLLEVGIKAPYNSIHSNAKALESIDSKLYKECQSLDKDQQKQRLDFENPNEHIDFLPYADGHIPKSDDEEILF